MKRVLVAGLYHETHTFSPTASSVARSIRWTESVFRKLLPLPLGERQGVGLHGGAGKIGTA